MLKSRTLFARLAHFAVAVSILLYFSAMARAQNDMAADIAITNINVIDVISGEIHPDQTILIRDGMIVGVYGPGDAHISDGTQVIDHAGHYAIPGLWDMHVHFRGGPELADDNERMLTRYLGYGVTGVRDAAGDIPDKVMTWRDNIAAGRMAGPVIFTSLRKIDGPDAIWAGSLSVSNEADIENALDVLMADKPDFIKIYDSTIAPDIYIATLRAAEARGLKTSAHMPFSLAFEDMIAAGLDNIEHALYLHKAASINDRAISNSIRAARNSASGSRAGNAFPQMMESYDRDHALGIFREMAERGVTVTPTLYIDHLLRFLDANDHTADAELGDIPLSIRETYRGRVASAARRSPEAIERDHNRIKATIALTGLAHEAGVMMLAGSDTGASNSYVYPGDSLHQEMRMLVEAGLSPLDALRAATINGAQWLGQTERYGSIEKGKAADILILADNPLVTIENTRHSVALIRAGSYLDADKLRSFRALAPQ